MLIWSSRIARYAAAFAASNQTAPSSIHNTQSRNHPKAASNTVRISPVPSSQISRGPSSRSSVELRSLDTLNEHSSIDKRDQGWNSGAFPESPTHGGHRQPSIFPGVVRQRTRRQSLRQSSGSENDFDASGGSGVGLSSSWVRDRDGKSSANPVLEEPSD